MSDEIHQPPRDLQIPLRVEGRNTKNILEMLYMILHNLTPLEINNATMQSAIKIDALLGALRLDFSQILPLTPVMDALQDLLNKIKENTRNAQAFEYFTNLANPKFDQATDWQTKCVVFYQKLEDAIIELNKTVDERQKSIPGQLAKAPKLLQFEENQIKSERAQIQNSTTTIARSVINSLPETLRPSTTQRFEEQISQPHTPTS